MKHVKSTHPVIFGIGTVECIVSSDKTELVRSCAVGPGTKPTLQFGSRRQRRERSSGRARHRDSRRERRASSSPGRKDELPPVSACLTRKNVACVAFAPGFWQAVCDQLSPFSLFLCRFTRLRSKLCFFGFCHNADKLKKHHVLCL